MKNRSILIFIILINIFINTSCWNYKEINEKLIVAGVTVDYDDITKKVIISVEISKPELIGNRIEISSEVLQEKGDTVFEVVRSLISTAGMKLFWSHTKVIIFSENVLKHEEIFLSAIDFFSRDAECRDDIWILLSSEKNAYEIFKAKVDIERIVSYHLESIIKNEKNFSKFHATRLYELIDNLSIKGIEPTIPTVDTEKFEDKIIARIFGTSILKGTKKVGWLNGNESKTFLTIINKLNGGTINVNQKVRNEIIPIALEIFKNKTKIEPKFENDTITMIIDVKTTVNINEVGTEKDFINGENFKKLKSDGEKLIEKNIINLIKKVQRNYNSDIFGFGLIIEREMPDVWKELKPKWDYEFKNVKVIVNSELNIRGSALRSKTIKIGE